MMMSMGEDGSTGGIGGHVTVERGCMMFMISLYVQVSV